jgi:hypothetical protein
MNRKSKQRKRSGDFEEEQSETSIGTQQLHEKASRTTESKFSQMLGSK